MKKSKNCIDLFFHCKKCMEELKKLSQIDDLLTVTPQEYSRLECGWTKKGFQVWCIRHDVNVINFDLMGQQGQLI